MARPSDSVMLVAAVTAAATLSALLAGCIPSPVIQGDKNGGAEGVPTRLPRNGYREYRFEVSGDVLWVPTDLPLREGQRIEVVAAGEVSLSTDPDYSQPVGPRGFLTPCWTNIGNPCVMEGAPYGGLIARIGDGEPFYLGGASVFVVQRSGTLYLATNDNPLMYADNSGAFHVIVRLGMEVEGDSASRSAMILPVRSAPRGGPGVPQPCGRAEAKARRILPDRSR